MRPTISTRTLLVSVLSSLVPAAVLAQSRHAIAFHLGRNDALPTETTLGGLSYTSWAGMLGVRGSGALALGRVDRTTNNADGTLKITAWTADADVIFSPFRVLPASMTAGLRPFALGGIGGHGARYPGGDRASVATLSYGWGLAWNLSRALSIESTARRRTLLQEEVDLPPGFANDWSTASASRSSLGDVVRQSAPVRHGDVAIGFMRIRTIVRAMSLVATTGARPFWQSPAVCLVHRSARRPSSEPPTVTRESGT